MAQKHPATVLPLQTLPELLQHLTGRADPYSSSIIACASKDRFLHVLSSALASTASDGRSHAFSVPTLSLLSSLEDYKLSFCPDVASLRAYLSHLSHTTSPSQAATAPKAALLVLINPLQIHRDTPSFSAQGLGRTFAAAVSTATALCQQLVLAECRMPASAMHPRFRPAHDDKNEADRVILTQDEEMEVQMGEAQEPSEPNTEADPWEEKVPILDAVVARKWSAREDRPWAGRTVTCRSIAARWARFEWTNAGDEAG